MNYENSQIAEAAALLKARFEGLANKADIVRAPELKAIFDGIRLIEPERRSQYGQEANALRQELQNLVEATSAASVALPPIDITAPFDVNTAGDRRPQLLPSQNGTSHPLMTELNIVLDIFGDMGFTAIESREIDDDFHMFESLNFPENHPARDHYDTFMTEQTDGQGKSFIAPAHTSTMQHRVIKQYKVQLQQGTPIAAVIPGRVFRNEDLDARHEHTFYQVEGVYVGRGVTVGNLIGTLKTFLQSYYGQDLEVKTQPFYFPLTEPSF